MLPGHCQRNMGIEQTHHSSYFKMKECGVYLQYKKVVKDQEMPKDLVWRWQCCVEWMHWPSPPGLPSESDGEGPVGNKYISTDDITGLLGLVSNAPRQVNIGDHTFDDGSDGEILLSFDEGSDEEVGGRHVRGC